MPRRMAGCMWSRVRYAAGAGRCSTNWWRAMRVGGSRWKVERNRELLSHVRMSRSVSTRTAFVSRFKTTHSAPNRVFSYLEVVVFQQLELVSPSGSSRAIEVGVPDRSGDPMREELLYEEASRIEHGDGAARHRNLPGKPRRAGAALLGIRLGTSFGI